MMRRRKLPLVQLALLGLVMTTLPSATLARGSHEGIDLQGVTLVLGMGRDAVLKGLAGFSVRRDGEEDYWNVYSTPESSKWIGSVFFKHGKLALVIKSWAQADDKTMNGVIRNMMAGHKSCGFTIAEVPSPGSPLRLTTLACPERQVVMQVNSDEAMGLSKCNVEVLGDPGSRLREPSLWRSCR